MKSKRRTKKQNNKNLSHNSLLEKKVKKCQFAVTIFLLIYYFLEPPENSSSSSSVVVFSPGKRRIREDYRIKYAYLDYVTGVDLRGLESLAEDVRLSLQILDNSYLAIVNSLVILNERQKRQSSNSSKTSVTDREKSSSASASKSTNSNGNFINSKVAENFRQSDIESLSTYPDTYEWTIEKFCNQTTRELEFQHLFQEVGLMVLLQITNYNFYYIFQSKNYISTVRPVITRKTKINMARFGALVRQVFQENAKSIPSLILFFIQGKSLLGIIELLNSNYSNNFLDIFRLC